VWTGSGVDQVDVSVSGRRIADLGSSSGERVDLRGALLTPGLINAHDHLAANHYGRLQPRSRYVDAADWAAESHALVRTDPALVRLAALPWRERLVFGAVKNLVSGVTTVAHHDPMPRWARLPIHLVAGGWSHSLYLSGDRRVRRSHRRTRPTRPWIIHAGEGTTEASRGELSALDRAGVLTANAVIVHGVAFGAAEWALMRRRGTALVWCPTSNLALLGRTAKPSGLLSVGRVALGSDSRLTGGRDLFSDLRLAAEQVGPERALGMVTRDAARILRLPRRGQIRAGNVADLAAWAVEGDPLRSLLDGGRRLLALLMRRGRPVLGLPRYRGLFDRCGVRTVVVMLDGRAMLADRKVLSSYVSGSLAEPGLTVGG